MGIKILHTADIHIGVENYGSFNPKTALNTRVEDFLNSFDIIVNHAINNNFDLVIFAGDAFKVQSPNSTHQREFAKRVNKLSENNIPTILLAGNHDITSKYYEATSMDIYSALKIKNVYVIERAQNFNIETKNGLVQIIAIPYILKSHLLTYEKTKGKTIEEIDKYLIESLDYIINKFISESNLNLPLIGIFHLGIDNAVLGSEKDLMIGKGFTVPLSVVAKQEFDYVALGHIHKHQVLSKKPLTIYPGSIERIDFGEENDDKGFIIVDLEKNNTTYEFIKLPAREFLTINIDLTNINDEDINNFILNKIEEKDVKNKIVRLKYTINFEKTYLINDKDIREKLKDTFFFKIEPNILDSRTKNRSRNYEINESVSNKPIEALKKYLESIQIQDDFKKDIVDRANKLLEKVFLEK
ncbi:MAG: nuclease SbcCD subunit D [Candidatus Sericytochromatia bacterium]|nr:MAG: nuclease SbcCD subunit D [Candidatus Sericytochromatia bacterium]